MRAADRYEVLLRSDAEIEVVVRRELPWGERRQMWQEVERGQQELRKISKAVRELLLLMVLRVGLS